MAMASAQAERAAVDALRALFRRERQYARTLARQERLRMTLAERVERGVALRNPVVDESDADACCGSRSGWEDDGT